MFSDITNEIEIIKCKIEWKIFDLEKHEDFMQYEHFLSRIYVSLVHVGSYNYNKLKAKFKIYAINEYNDEVFIASEKIDFKYYQVESKYHIDGGISRSDGSIMICCEVEFVPYDLNCENEFKNYWKVDKSLKLLENVNAFRKEKFTDFIIKIENEKINVHKCILSQNSKVFERMFEQNGMIESQKGELIIIDSTIECFKAFIEYLYTGEIEKEIFENNVDDLFAISHKYEVFTLIKICENYMSLNINEKNLKKRYYFAELYELELIEKACVNFIFENKKKFLVSNEWKEFKNNNKNLANKLLEKAMTNGNKKSNIKRLKHSKEQILALENAYNSTHYPDQNTRQKLSKEINLTENQIRIWFRNRRAKYRKRI